MRRGFLLVVFVLAGLVVFGLILISPRRGTTVPAQPDSLPSGSETELAEAQPSRETNLSAPIELPPDPPLGIASAQKKASDTADLVSDDRDKQHKARLAARVAEFKNLSRKTDDASVATLLSEVKNPDEEIRQAALEAISLSGHRAALPGLREIAAQTEDRQEKKAIEDVIEFMSLPTLTEVLRGQAATERK